MDIELLKLLCENRSIRWTNHGLERMQERNISIADVKNCILCGEIIEDYPDDYPNPSALIYGTDSRGTVMHVVCGTDGSTLYVITAYYPSDEIFETDMKTRRK